MLVRNARPPILNIHLERASKVLHGFVIVLKRFHLKWRLDNFCVELHCPMFEIPANKLLQSEMTGSYLQFISISAYWHHSGSSIATIQTHNTNIVVAVIPGVINALLTFLNILSKLCSVLFLRGKPFHCLSTVLGSTSEKYGIHSSIFTVI